MKSYYFIFIVLFFFSCKEDENLPPNNNSVEVTSISAEVLSTGGVTLKGSIKNAELELDYGFIIYTNSTSTPSLLDARLNRIITGLYNGSFEIVFKNDLYNTQNYYYRAFAYTSNKTILGEEKEFISAGSSQPIIKELIPEIGYINDTVTIVGKCFSKNITLTLNDTKVTPLKVNDSLIKFIVPKYPTDRRYDNITIRKSTGEQIKYENFGIHIPEVYAITPNLAYDTDTLTITGNHFDLRKEANTVFIGNYGKLEIIEASRTELKVKGPGAFSNLKPRFKIRAQHTEIDVYDKLDIILPEVTSVSKVIKFDTPFTIKGSDFPYTKGCSFRYRYRPSLNRSTFLEAVACYRDSLIVTLNKESYLKDFYQNEIETKYFDVDKTFFSEYYIDEPIIKVKGSYLEETHVYKDEMYTFSNHFNYSNDYVAKFDEEEKDFILKEEFKIDDTSVGSTLIKCFYKDTFYYVRSFNGENILFGYNFITKINTRLKEVPGDDRFYGFIKGFEDYLYFGLGSAISGPIQNFKDILRYSIKDNTWEEFAELDYPDISERKRDNPLVFFLNNSIYVGAGNIRKNDLYAVDLDSREITKKKSLPFTIYGDTNNSYIIKDNKLLFFKKYFYEYDPNLNEWSIIDAFKDEKVYNLDSFKHMIVYRNEVYGYDGSFYKFNNKYF